MGKWIRDRSSWFHIALLLNVFVAGCSDADGDDERAERQVPSAPASTRWHEEIAPIVQEKCTGCHQADGIAPFSMTDYESAKPWASAMADAIEQGRMPPFLAQETDACQPRLPWAQDIRLSEREKKQFRSWAKAGAPEGSRSARKAPSQPSLVALPREDVVLRLPEPIQVEGMRDIHTCVIVDPGIDENRYVTGRLIKSGNSRVLHHVVSYLVQPGQNADGKKRDKAQLEAAIRERHGVGIGGRYDCFGGPDLPGLSIEMLDGWAPGSLADLAPPGSGQPLDKDALVLLDVHYHPTGEAQVDADTSLSLMFADERPERVSRVILLGNTEKREEFGSGIAELLKQPGEDSARFVIPPNVKDHVEEMTWTWKLGETELRVYATGTHMHYVGRDMRIGLERAAAADRDEDDECLIQTPQWDFNWQRGYGYDAEYDELPVMRDGDMLRMRCVYDNTMGNRFVAQALRDRGMDEPIEVKLGEDTLDEMCVGAVGIMYPNSNSW